MTIGRIIAVFVGPEWTVTDMRLGDLDALYQEFEKAAWYNNADRDEVAESLLLDAPTIDAVPVVHGRWIEKYDLYDKGFYISSKIWWECSSCGMKTVWRDEAFNEKCGYNYCPNCGARMDGQ